MPAYPASWSTFCLGRSASICSFVNSCMPRCAAAAAAQRGMHEFTKEQIDAERPKQKVLHEAGYAGITWPVEYGGQGQSPAHERAFLEEAANYELPNFGIAGGTTFGV